MKPAAYKQVTKLMGNRFEFTPVSDSETKAIESTSLAIAEVKRIEALLTTFNDESETNLINRHAGIKPVAVSAEVFALIERSLKISQLTQGAFDITYGSLDKSLWNFDVTMTSLPDAMTAEKSVRLINYRNVILDKTSYSVFLKEKGIRIGFGAIGKGYAASQAMKTMRSVGITSGIVNAGGDLVTWGTQPDGAPWTIAIADPNQSSTAFSTLNISNMAIATSGNYEKFAIIDGKKYSHTIDPRSGLPVTGVKSVSIICPSAELADAMATPVLVMGAAVGLDLINQMKGIACIIIDDDNRLYCSHNINLKN